MLIASIQLLENFLQEKLQNNNRENRNAVTMFGGSVLLYYGGNMKKAGCILLDILTVAFLIGAYAIHYFTKRKMGMLRWINYHNMQIQKAAVYDVWKYITVIAAIVLIMLVVMRYMKKKEFHTKLNFVMLIIMIVLGILYFWLTVFQSVGSIASYYF